MSDCLHFTAPTLISNIWQPATFSSERKRTAKDQKFIAVLKTANATFPPQQLFHYRHRLKSRFQRFNFKFIISQLLETAEETEIGQIICSLTRLDITRDSPILICKPFAPLTCSKRMLISVRVKVAEGTSLWNIISLCIKLIGTQTHSSIFVYPYLVCKKSKYLYQI